MKRRDFLKQSMAAGGVTFFSPEALAAVIGGGRKTVLLGATAYACGRALSRPDEVLVLERGLHPAPEFTLSLDPETAGTPVSKIGKAFAACLEKEGVLTEGRLYHQPMADLLTGFLHERGVQMLLATEFAEARKQPNGYHVTVCGNAGPVSFDADNVIDMRPKRALAVTGVLARKGPSTETRLFRVALSSDTGPAAARLALADTWEQRKSEFPGWELVAEAGTIKRDTGYDDFFSAFEAGLSAV